MPRSCSAAGRVLGRLPSVSTLLIQQPDAVHPEVRLLSLRIPVQYKLLAFLGSVDRFSCSVGVAFLTCTKPASCGVTAVTAISMHACSHLINLARIALPQFLTFLKLFQNSSTASLPAVTPSFSRIRDQIISPATTANATAARHLALFTPPCLASRLGVGP
ncbi:uncharacterized protein BDZ99DRAFT_457255 [Mytilinidion resinicola]|uniref:Uncharacterized protein n=1 Tax=Mytilinidion resinicola TaxID=574789 RepID=A0A6A6ZB51_9PEZI|nr:uncharacterized protein BDZ99DRAFT_457255 [Mytilinidion resinicola]KAF2817534.1 hypothetical protein BDZ99DRAFT_457255 [Mytilinidion resinicola]